MSAVERSYGVMHRAVGSMVAARSTPALLVERSKSRTRRRLRIRWAKNRSTIHLFGRSNEAAHVLAAFGARENQGEGGEAVLAGFVHELRQRLYMGLGGAQIHGRVMFTSFVSSGVLAGTASGTGTDSYRLASTRARAEAPAGAN